MKAIVLLNERSGACLRLGGPQSVETIRAAFAAVGVEAAVSCISGERIPDEVKAAVARGADVVVAGGGDGTVNSVAAALAHGETPLGVLPMGTLNHFAKDLGIPLDLEGAVAVIAANRPGTVDIGRVNDQVFINNSSLGVYARAVIERDHTRNRLGLGKWPAMLLAAVKTFRLAPMLHVRLDIDGNPVRLKTPLLFIGNNRYRLELPKVGARDRLDEGVLSLYVATAHTRWGMLKLLFRAAFGKLRQSRDLEAMYAKEVWIDTRHRRLHVAIDGEILRMGTPLHYEIRPKALRVLVPEAPDFAK
jgi:YegS/Rv2252/BmrU family lipid kinase